MALVAPFTRSGAVVSLSLKSSPRKTKLWKCGSALAGPRSLSIPAAAFTVSRVPKTARFIKLLRLTSFLAVGVLDVPLHCPRDFRSPPPARRGT